MGKKNVYLKICVATCLLLLLSSCGLVYDAGVGIGSINWPERYRGKLYDPSFYRTATEDDVRELIAGRSLANESTTYTKKEFARRSDWIGLNDLFSPVFPNSYVATTTTTVRPVDVARKHSPRREVVALVESATGISREESLAYRLLTDEDTPFASLLEEYQDASFSCAVCSVLVGARKLSDLEAYLERYPEADLDCTPQDVYMPGGYSTLSTPVVRAMGNNDLDALKMLLRKGAGPASWQYSDNFYSPFPEKEFAALLLKPKDRIPQKTCDELAQLFNYSDENKYSVFLDYIYDSCSFSPQASTYVLGKAILWNRTALLKKLLRQGVKPEAGKEYTVHDSVESSTKELEGLLKTHGARIKGIR